MLRPQRQGILMRPNPDHAETCRRDESSLDCPRLDGPVRRIEYAAIPALAQFGQQRKTFRPEWETPDARIGTVQQPLRAVAVLKHHLAGRRSLHPRMLEQSRRMLDQIIGIA